MTVRHVKISKNLIVDAERVLAVCMGTAASVRDSTSTLFVEFVDGASVTDTDPGATLGTVLTRLRKGREDA